MTEDHAVFYWPTSCNDVEEFTVVVLSVRSPPKRVPKAPLVPLPVVSTPFQKIAMDIVGPLPRSQSGCHYILVICDYAMRYPELYHFEVLMLNILLRN